MKIIFMHKRKHLQNFINKDKAEWNVKNSVEYLAHRYFFFVVDDVLIVAQNKN